jgi:hypothetical protein
MSEQIVTIFKLLGRKKPKNPKPGKGNNRWDLAIQPMMELPERGLGERQK